MGRGAASRADVTTTSRIAVVVSQDGFRIRGKITLSFQRPNAAEVAEQAAAMCERLLGHRFREEVSGGALPVQEAELVSWLQENLPQGFPRVRIIRIHGLHVLGALSGSGTMAATHAPGPPASPRANPSAPGRSSSATHQLKWVRRRGSWARRLGAIDAGEPVALLLQPIAIALRDAAARIATSTLLAIDHEGFDLYACIEGKAHADLAVRVRAEAMALACASLAAALSQTRIPGGQTTVFLEGVLRLLDPTRVLATKLPSYLAQAEPAAAYVSAVASIAAVNPATMLEPSLGAALAALSDDIRAQTTFIQQRV